MLPTDQDSQGILSLDELNSALCAALIEKYQTLEQATHLLTYSHHLPIEFAVMLIKDLITKDEGIAEVEAFDGWMEQYGEYIV